MANWTVSTSTTSTTQSSSVSGGTKVLTITPNVGYVLSAGDFKIGEATETSTGSGVWTGGNLDSTITQVAFADTGTAGTASNTVTATVTFTSFTMPTSSKTLYIDIDEDVEVSSRVRYFCITSKHTAETNGNGVNKHDVTYASAPTGITTVNSSGSTVFNVGNGVVGHRHNGEVPEGTAFPGNQIFQVTFTANTLYGYFY